MTITFIIRNSEAHIKYKVDLDEKEELNFGTNKQCDCCIPFNDNLIASYHFNLKIVDGEMYIRDLDTTNGTIINNIAFKGNSKGIRLNISDIIQIGFTFICMNECEGSQIMDNTKLISSGNNRTILPIANPPIATYSRFTHIATILTAHSSIDEWLFNNHILLWIFSAKHHLAYWADFKYNSEKELCPLIKENKKTRADISTEYNCISEFIIENIQNKAYIHLNVDTYYIPEYWGPREPFHRIHEILVYGYNLDKETLFVADFFYSGEVSKYQFKEIPISTFKKAYESIYLDEAGVDFLNGVMLLNFEPIEYNIDIQRIKGLISDSLKSIDTTVYSSWDIFENEMVYGMKYFNELKKYIDEKVCSKDYIDVRPFYLLYVLNSIMLKRIDYLMKNGYIINKSTDIKQKFINISKKVNVMKSMIYKYMISKDANVLNKLKDRIDMLEIEEKEALGELLMLL